MKEALKLALRLTPQDQLSTSQTSILSEIIPSKSGDGRLAVLATITRGQSRAHEAMVRQIVSRASDLEV